MLTTPVGAKARAVPTIMDQRCSIRGKGTTRNMTKAGMDQTMRMRISGHKTPSMSTRYNIIVADDIAEEKKRMDDWFKKERAKQEQVKQKAG